MSCPIECFHFDNTDCLQSAGDIHLQPYAGLLLHQTSMFYDFRPFHRQTFQALVDQQSLLVLASPIAVDNEKLTNRRRHYYPVLPKHKRWADDLYD